MKYNYETYFKMIENRRYYFVKKYMQFKEFGENLADVLEGYGMHTDFGKACSIAGIREQQLQQQLFDELQNRIAEVKVIEMNHPMPLLKSING